jgi:hypothetical protein
LPDSSQSWYFHFYHTTWEYRALKMTLEDASAAGLHWRAHNAITDHTIAKNFRCGFYSPEVTSH